MDLRLLSCHIPFSIVYICIKVYCSSPFSVGINPQVWEQAKKDNPDPKRLMHDDMCLCDVVVMLIKTTLGWSQTCYHLQHIY